jgi:hypothetical protein
MDGFFFGEKILPLKPPAGKTPRGWHSFCSLLTHFKLRLFQNFSFGTASLNLREKPGRALARFDRFFQKPVKQSRKKDKQMKNSAKKAMALGGIAAIVLSACPAANDP